MNIKEILNVGVDVGSTTVKGVVLNSNNAIVWKKYSRHNARQPQMVHKLLEEIRTAFPDNILYTFITGSGGRAIAPYINGCYIQEVNAVTYAVEKLFPETGSVIELGGQDAKVIIWKGDLGDDDRSTLTFMNDKCAGGTGATIDKILGKIGLSTQEAATIDPVGKTIHHVAAKCGVFAETDVVGLLKAGVDRQEIFISLCAAIVKQNLEVLVRGNVLRDNVLLLGGPHTYIPAFTYIWRKILPETWKIHQWQPQNKSPDEAIFVPKDSQYFAAIGAVLFGVKTNELFRAINNGHKEDHKPFVNLKQLDSYINEGRLAQLESSGAVRDGLIQSEEELDEFIKKNKPPETKPISVTKGDNIECFIGIDGGSTSTKLAIINEKRDLIYSDYILSRGNPIEDVRGMFKNIDIWIKENKLSIIIKGTAVTGYASAILKEAFDFDMAVVETIAHMKSAVNYYGDIDVICDVGGQDIKVLFMKHGRVIDFKLNTQCSAGNGYFLQSMAEQFGIPVSEYANHAFKARKAPAFNYGCAVFMEQDKVNFQQLGWSKDEIMAGLALVLPLNIWNYVVQEANVSRFGNRFVLQGGTQKNMAAVKAQVDYLKSKNPNVKVHIHKYADICGAIGAAFEVNEQATNNKSSFIGIENACNIMFKTTNDETTRCGFCINKCTRTFIDITIGNNAKRYITGYGCDKGASEFIDEMKQKEKHKHNVKKDFPNMVHEASMLVFDKFNFETLPDANRPVAPIEYYPTDEIHIKNPKKPRPFQRSSIEAEKKRADMIIGIPRLLNMFYYTPFFSTYFRSLGVKDIIYSDFTSSKLWNEGNKWGAIDPCFPAKVAPAHIYNILEKRVCTHICFPMITHLESTVDNTMGNNACVIQMGTPEVVDAVFTRERNYFEDYGVNYWKPLVAMDKPLEVVGLLYNYFADRLGITKDENAWAVKQGQKAMNIYLSTLRMEGRAIINKLVDTDSIGILMIGHPYHNDPGLNHGILEAFQMHSFPVLCMESLPTDDEFLKPLFGKNKLSDEIAKLFDIKDVWKSNFNRNTNIKFWAAKIAARHPNIAVIDLSSFKCGHDAPTYSYIDNILDASATPHFLFHDIDQNKPGATFNIRIQTIEYFLRLEEKRLRKKITSVK